MKNDQQILDLKAKIKAKRELIGPARRFRPVTNCSLELSGTRCNLHTLTKDILVLLAARINMLVMSADNLGLELPKLSGYSVTEWLEDIKARLVYLDTKDERKRLDMLEVQLENLLSSEKQTELAISALADLI